MNKSSGPSVIDMQRHRKDRQQLQRLYEILLASQDEPTAGWSSERTIKDERKNYEAVMAEVLPLLPNSSSEPH